MIFDVLRYLFYANYANGTVGRANNLKDAADFIPQVLAGTIPKVRRQPVDL